MTEKATKAPQKIAQVAVCHQHLYSILGSAAKIESRDKLNMLSDMAGFQKLASLLSLARGSLSDNADLDIQ